MTTENNENISVPDTDVYERSSQAQIDAMREILEANPMQVSPVTGQATSNSPEQELRPQQLSEAVDAINDMFTPEVEKKNLNEAKLYTGVTTTDTKHGQWSGAVTIPAGTKVKVSKATNIPQNDRNSIAYWLESVIDVKTDTMDQKTWMHKLKSIRDGQGVGFRASDLKIN